MTISDRDVAGILISEKKSIVSIFLTAVSY